ncbi:MAG: hypothetical protein HRU35_01435 [Rickettsiaceae bacterium]|nr:hypothetical protein [Rickettsiaceae bacterium]
MAVTVGSTVADIISRPRNASDSSKLYNKYVNTAKQLTDGEYNKYKNFVEISAAGLNDEYTTMKKTAVKYEQYKITNIKASKDAKEQLNALAEIKKVFQEFQVNVTKTHDFAGTKEQKADNALDEINKILRKQGVEGNYLFGGKNTDKAPVEKGALRERSNIIGDNYTATGNYTEAIANNATVKLSDDVQHEIPKNRLHPADPAICKIIGAINVYKERGDEAPYHDAVHQATQEFVELEITIGQDQKRIEQATHDNQLQQAELDDNLNELFTVGPVESATRLADLGKLTQASWLVEQSRGKLEKLFFEKN